jgi:hypothetical protein
VSISLLFELEKGCLIFACISFSLVLYFVYYKDRTIWLVMMLFLVKCRLMRLLVLKACLSSLPLTCLCSACYLKLFVSKGFHHHLCLFKQMVFRPFHITNIDITIIGMRMSKHSTCFLNSIGLTKVV